MVSMEIIELEIAIKEDMARKYLTKVMFNASFFRSMVTLLMNATSRNIQMNMRQKIARQEYDDDHVMLMVTIKEDVNSGDRWYLDIECSYLINGIRD